MTPRVVVGVDGGGTGSRVVVSTTDGVELAREVGSAAIVIPGSETASLEAIRDLVRRGLHRAGVHPPVAALVAGLAGVGHEAHRLRMERLLSTSGLAHEVQVRTDAEVAYFDAFADGPGILLIGGTGSVAMARLPSGRSLRTGGWGAHFGDEGSGWSLGVAAIRGAIRGIEGRGPATLLSAAVAETFGTSELGELLDRLRSAAKGEIAALAPQIVQAAEQGDSLASALLDEAAEGLAQHVVPLAEAWRIDAPDAPVPVALLGGLVKPGGGLRTRLEPLLEAVGVLLHPGSPDPARGASRLARRSVA
jgi:N-acetylmuramic acid 6-phosphate etherase